ncbi:MAG: hypothetical protein K6E48_07150 [Lachnospiraceae bacterium]|nr:hypothetical protein [Lachnospiraceae bacterium]
MNEYYLTIIDDSEQVALASGFDTGVQTSIIVGFIMVMIFAIAMIVVAYFMECNKYRRRLTNLHAMLPGASPLKMGWNLGILRDQVREEEANCAELIMQSE